MYGQKCRHRLGSIQSPNKQILSHMKVSIQIYGISYVQMHAALVNSLYLGARGARICEMRLDDARLDS